MSELFDQPQRAKLLERGWFQVGGRPWHAGGRIFWKRPQDGALMLEDDAFRWLERTEAQEAREKEAKDGAKEPLRGGSPA